MRSPTAVARLKVTLDDVEPAVIRRLAVSLNLRLDRLHLALQAGLGWANTHLWEFRARGVGWGIPDPKWDRGSGPLDARKATLLKVFEDTSAKTLTYLSDFGGGWEHTVRIERIEPVDPAVSYALLIEAIGRCPPEDVGRPLGYDEFLAALANPGHGRRAEMLDWYATPSASMTSTSSNSTGPCRKPPEPGGAPGRPRGPDPRSSAASAEAYGRPSRVGFVAATIHEDPPSRQRRDALMLRELVNVLDVSG